MTNRSNQQRAAASAAPATASAEKELQAQSQKQGYITRDISDAKAEQARIVAEIEAMSAIPCTPTQEELNQAIANAIQAAPGTDDEAGA